MPGDIQPRGEGADLAPHYYTNEIVLSGGSAVYGDIQPREEREVN
jgi:hypothetical protein